MNEMTDAELCAQVRTKPRSIASDDHVLMHHLALRLDLRNAELAARNAQIERVKAELERLDSYHPDEPVEVNRHWILEQLRTRLASPESQPPPAMRNLLDELAACNQQVQRVMRLLDDGEIAGFFYVGTEAVRKALARPESQQPAMKCSCGHLESLHFPLKPKRPCAAYGCGCVGFEDALTATITPIAVRCKCGIPVSEHPNGVSYECMGLTPPARCQQISIGRQCKLEPGHKQDHEFAPLPHEIDNGEAQSKARAAAMEARNELSDAFRAALADYVGWWLDNNSRLKSAKASNSFERFLDAILAAAREGVK